MFDEVQGFQFYIPSNSYCLCKDPRPLLKRGEKIFENIQSAICTFSNCQDILSCTAKNPVQVFNLQNKSKTKPHSAERAILFLH